MKVSIVIATYASPRSELRRLVTSLDAQTMPPADFEVIFVDDGSPDDTVEELRRVQAQHSNYHVHRIPNSGWPSRPRNVGLGLAKGEYVLFMDHDDRLYPDALSAGYRFAASHQADVLNGKEAYTNNPSWGLDTYALDQPQSIGRVDVHPLVPLNPHMLYRTAFLRDHGLRFPEGRKVLWEDQFFNIAVAARAEVVSTLASVPFYHWVYTPGSGSTLFLKASIDYWYWLRKVLEAIRDELDAPRLHEQQDMLFRHQYVARVLGAFNESFVRRPQTEQQFILDNAATLQRDFGLGRFDGELSSSHALRAFCVAERDLDLLQRACAEDIDVLPTPSALKLQWVNGVLHIDAGVEWVSADGRLLPLTRRGDRVFKDLSPEVVQRVPEALLDVSAEVENARISVIARSRTSRIAWAQPSQQKKVAPIDCAEGAVVTAGCRATLDPATAAMGAPLDSTYWDLYGWSRLGAWATNRALRSTRDSTVSITNGHLHLVYPNDGGAATLIPDGQVEAVRRLVPTRAWESAESGVVVELAGAHDGEGDIGTKVAAAWDGEGWTDIPARLSIASSSASLILGEVHLPVHLRIGDRTGERVARCLLRRDDQGLALEAEVARGQ